MDRPHRMSLADTAWLRVERPENLMVVTAVLRLDEAVELAVLRALVQERLVGRFPTFSQRPVVGRLPLLPGVWRDDPEFDLDRHLVSRPTATKLDDATLAAVVGELMGTPLDLTRSPWQLHLVTGTDGRSALVARLQHCLADGIALASVLLSLMDDGESPPQRAQERPRTVAAGAKLPAAVLRTVVQVLGFVGEPRTPLRGRPGTRKVAAWTQPHQLAQVKAAATASGSSVNDVLLAAVAGGLRRRLLATGQRPVDLRVLVPVNLRPAGSDVPARLGNRFGLVFVQLPVSEPDRTRRLMTLTLRANAVKRTSQPLGTFALLSLVGALPAWGRALATRVLSSSATAVVTNVPGPRHELAMAGTRLRQVVFWVPQVGTIGVGFSIFSYAGTVTIGVAADAGLGLDPSVLCTDVEAELAAMFAVGVACEGEQMTEPVIEP